MERCTGRALYQATRPAAAAVAAAAAAAAAAPSADNCCCHCKKSHNFPLVSYVKNCMRIMHYKRMA